MARSTQKSQARAAQQKHWETLGQISSMIGLCNYILSSHHTAKTVSSSLTEARTYLQDALWKEQKNNQFINLNLPRGF